MKELSNPMNSG